MTGRVVAREPRSLRHHCGPGVTYTEITPDSDLYEIVGPGRFAAHPPSAYDYPPGTIWRCDECSRDWRATKRGVPFNSPGRIEWDRYRPLQWWCARHPVALYLMLAILVLTLSAALVASGVLS